jgi:tartrate dehydrogenase/decarboxylase/D-malate dehydrogenase
MENEGLEDEVAIQTSVFTRKNTEKVMQYAFDLAKKRVSINV